MVPFKRVVIVGVGLLGGSIGMALRARNLATEVIGVGRSGRMPAEAVSIGAVDRVESSIESAAENADLAIICTPVDNVVDAVRRCAAVMAGGALVTDVASTKANIVRSIDQLRLDSIFCGSHPLAGSHKSGAEHGSATLLEGRLVVITPGQNSDSELINRTERLWRMLGARTCIMAACDHDVALAQTSHLPHVVASALAAVTPHDLLGLVGSGWRDTTRIAEGNSHLWRQILVENRQSVLAAVEKYSQALDDWIAALRSNDGPRLERLLESGRETRDALGS